MFDVQHALTAVGSSMVDLPDHDEARGVAARASRSMILFLKDQELTATLLKLEQQYTTLLEQHQAASAEQNDSVARMEKGLNRLQAQQNIISERVEMLFAEHEDAAILRTSERGLKLDHHHGDGQVDRLPDVSNERPRLASAVTTDVETNALAARSRISHTSVSTLPLPILPALQIARELAKAQKEAVLSKRPQTFMVDVERRVVGMDSGNYFLQFDPVIKLSVETASSEVTNEHSGRIRFLPDGSSTGGRIELQHARIGARIDIDWSTGAVDVQVFGDWSSSSD